MELHWHKYALKFIRPGTTSRGVLYEKQTYFLILVDGAQRGIGECGLLAGLSADDRPDYEDRLRQLQRQVAQEEVDIYESLAEFPSIQFGWEQAMRDLQSENHLLFPSAFTRGESGQPINGLIWMGKLEDMKAQIANKLREGWSLLKMKIGSLDWEQELLLIRELRREYDSRELQIRVDANGAFTAAQAERVLQTLAELQVHSIEQPIARGQWQEMARLCETSPLSIALDEELIGIFSSRDKKKLLETIRPAYLILKPSFVGGWRGSEEWIELGKKVDAQWWVTSALESNIGLNAIAQWNFTMHNDIPSGLGTGSLYHNNIPSPLHTEKGMIYYRPEQSWQIPFLK